MNGKQKTIPIITVTEDQLRQIIKDEISLIKLPEQIQPGPTNNKTEFLTTEQVMELLSCSRSTVRNLINSETLKPIYFGDKKYFRYKDIIQKMVEV